MNWNPYKSPDTPDRESTRRRVGLRWHLLYANLGLAVVLVVIAAVNLGFNLYETEYNMPERYASYDIELTVVGPNKTFYLILLAFNVAVAIRWWRSGSRD
jgi:hypothetical protein